MDQLLQYVESQLEKHKEFDILPDDTNAKVINLDFCEQWGKRCRYNDEAHDVDPKERTNKRPPCGDDLITQLKCIWSAIKKLSPRLRLERLDKKQFTPFDFLVSLELELKRWKRKKITLYPPPIGTAPPPPPPSVGLGQGKPLQPQTSTSNRRENPRAIPSSSRGNGKDPRLERCNQEASEYAAERAASLRAWALRDYLRTCECPIQH